MLQDIQSWQQDFCVNIEIRTDDRFLATIDEFARWAKDYKQLRIEYFYRYMHNKYKILLDNRSKPEGGQWNYDSQNCKATDSDIRIPTTYKNTPDDITKRVINLVEKTFADNFDDIEPLNAVEGFIRQILSWREFVRGVYWLKMPYYQGMNYLEAKSKLPSFYWDAHNKMNCLQQCVKETKQNAYAHYIQRSNGIR